MISRPTSTRCLHGPVNIPAVRLIRCDCGFEASSDDEEELVGRARTHAQDVHGVDASAEQFHGLAAPTAQKKNDD